MARQPKTTETTPQRARRGGGAKAESWRPKFLAALAESCNVTYSATVAGIDRHTAYDHRNKDEAFRALWDDAIEQGVDGLELAARRRAMESSDTLAIFLLKAHRPERYRENQSIDITSAGQAVAGWVLREVQVNMPAGEAGSNGAPLAPE